MATLLGANKTVRVADAGVVFNVQFVEPDPNDPDVEIPKDISDATLLEIIFRRPNPILTSFAKTASFITDGVDGRITVTTVVGDLDTVGRWALEGHVVTPTGEFTSERGFFDVQEIIV